MNLFASLRHKQCFGSCSHSFRYLASLAFTMAVKFGDTPTIAKLCELFDRFFDTATSRMIPGPTPAPLCVLFITAVLVGFFITAV
jgi:hypothetical protein